MRGKPDYTYVAYSDGGITPADAGKTFRCSFDAFRCRDHPRGCGENHFRIMTVAARMGSPPRMRGKPLRAVLIVVDIGITPADAGKTKQYQNL